MTTVNLFCNCLSVSLLLSFDLVYLGAYMGKVRNAYTILVRRPNGKRPLGKPSHR
jgi:hypothetical protein